MGGGAVASISLACLLCGCVFQPTSQAEPTDTYSEEPASTYAEEEMEEIEPVYSIGETVETDTFRFTLENIEPAVALTHESDPFFAITEDEIQNQYINYGLPKEYDPEEDADNSWVASKGYTLIAGTFTIENLDRTVVFIEPEFFTLKYDDKTYTHNCSVITDKNEDVHLSFTAVKMKDEKLGYVRWEPYGIGNIALDPGQKVSFRFCLDSVPVEFEDFRNSFFATFTLPTVNDCMRITYAS